jgi:hypothetical protein
MDNNKRSSDSNFWNLVSEEINGKLHRVRVADVLGLPAVASLKLDGAQLVHVYKSHVDLSLVSDEGAAPAPEMKLT